MDSNLPRIRTSYADLAFGPHARARQEAAGAPRREEPGGADPFVLDSRDAALIRRADLFFLSTVTDAGWPYLQHKGGPPGFVHVLDDRTLAFPDFPGNQQYVTAGNIDCDGRVCLFFIDFPTRRRLKVFGAAHIIDAAEDPGLVERMRDLGPGSERKISSRIERVILVEIVDADANCARHITPRWDRAAVDERIALYRADITDLQTRISILRQNDAGAS